MALTKVKNLGLGTTDAQNNVLVGDNAGDSFSGTDAEHNTLIGKDTGTAITTGDKNTAVGLSLIHI